MMMIVKMAAVRTTVTEPFDASALRAKEGQRAAPPAGMKCNVRFSVGHI